MSTKIYNAYQYDGTVHGLMVWLVGFRKRYWKMCAGMLRGTTRHRDHREKSSAALMVDYLRKIIARGQRDYHNFLASAVVYPVLGPQGDGLVFVQFFGVDDTYRSAAKRFRLPARFSDFHYQNQADEPEGMGWDEWEARRKMWDKIMKHSDVPGQAGLTFDIFSKDNLWDFVISEGLE